MTQSCLNRIINNYKELSNSLSELKSEITKEDLLNSYYYPQLQKFIDGKISDLNSFFSCGPGRFLLRYLMDRFCYHTNNNPVVCETFYCNVGEDCKSHFENNFYNLSLDKKEDDDFLNLKKYIKNFSFLKERLFSFKKCDKCLHRYYCGLPCILFLKENNVKIESIEDRCYITKELFKWYENHMNSILKAFYIYSNSHTAKFKEDDTYQKIGNDRLNSKYFDIDIDSDKASEFYNCLIIRAK